VKATIRNGWLTVPYSGPELTTIEILVGATWYPAYLDWDDRHQRIAMIRPPAPLPAQVEVKLRVAGTEYQ
jgi:hypothetical protein